LVIKEAYAKPPELRFIPPISRNLRKIGDTPHEITGNGSSGR
jgi:hypothetical protein